MHKKGNYSYDYTSAVYRITCKNQTSFLYGRLATTQNTDKQIITTLNSLKAND